MALVGDYTPEVEPAVMAEYVTTNTITQAKDKSRDTGPSENTSCAHTIFLRY